MEEPKFKRKTPVGEKFGKLTVIGDGTHGTKPCGRTKRMVKVSCDCGNVCDKLFTDVINKQTKSCGKCPREPAYKDLTGLVSGRLTAVKFHSRPTNKRGINWVCKCTCGRSCIYTSNELSKKMVSNCGVCGSSTRSDANYYAEEILTYSSDGFLGVPVGYTGKGGKLVVLLQDEKLTEIEVATCDYRRGNYVNPNNPRVQGVGYFGQGEYKAKVDGKHTDEYADWRAMMVRCYSGRYDSYKDVKVCEEWHNFQNFAEWAKNNGISENLMLDKDLVVKGSKLYSPSTCTYLPPSINSFIVRERSNDLPLGVDTVEKRGETLYRAQARENGSNIWLGNYNTPEEAFYKYKEHKEFSAKKLALKYKDTLPTRAFDALYNYTVDIED